MATEYEWGSKTSLPIKVSKELIEDSVIVSDDLKKYLEDIAYLRAVIRDCLILAGCEPSQPRAERRIHGIDFVVSILDALRSAYDATNQYPDKYKEQIESVIREKIRKEMDKTKPKEE